MTVYVWTKAGWQDTRFMLNPLRGKKLVIALGLLGYQAVEAPEGCPPVNDPRR